MTLKEYLANTKHNKIVWKGKAKDLRALLKLQKRVLKIKNK